MLRGSGLAALHSAQCALLFVRFVLLTWCRYPAMSRLVLFDNQKSVRLPRSSFPRFPRCSLPETPPFLGVASVQDSSNAVPGLLCRSARLHRPCPPMVRDHDHSTGFVLALVREHKNKSNNSNSSKAVSLSSMHGTDAGSKAVSRAVSRAARWSCCYASSGPSQASLGRRQQWSLPWT